MTARPPRSTRHRRGRAASLVRALVVLAIALGLTRTTAAAQDLSAAEAISGTGSGSITRTSAAGCQDPGGPCVDAIAGSLAGSPLTGTFAGSLTTTGLVGFGGSYEGSAAGTIVLDDLAGGTLTLAVEGAASLGAAGALQGVGATFVGTGGGRYAGRQALGTVQLAVVDGTLAVTVSGTMTASPTPPPTADLPAPTAPAGPTAPPTTPPAATVPPTPLGTAPTDAPDATATPPATASPTVDPTTSGTLAVNVARCQDDGQDGTVEYLLGAETQPIGACGPAVGTEVVARNAATGLTYSATTDANGAATLTLPTGTFTAAVTGDLDGGSVAFPVDQGQSVSLLAIVYVATTVPVATATATRAPAELGTLAVEAMACASGVGSGTEIRTFAPVPGVVAAAPAGDGVAIDDPREDPSCAPAGADFAVYPFGDAEADPAATGSAGDRVDLPANGDEAPYLLQALGDGGAVLAEADVEIEAGAVSRVVIVRLPAAGGGTGGSGTGGGAASPVPGGRSGGGVWADGTGIETTYWSGRPGTTDGVRALPRAGSGGGDGGTAAGWVVVGLMGLAGLAAAGRELRRRLV